MSVTRLFEPTRCYRERASIEVWERLVYHIGHTLDLIFFQIMVLCFPYRGYAMPTRASLAGAASPLA